MKSIVFTRYGTPDVLHLAEREPLDPGAGEARVRIVVSGVNPTDWKSRLGTGDGAATDVESVPNQDGAGVVDAIGAGVTNVSVGDRVWIFLSAHERPAFGTAQEYTLVPAERLTVLPESVGFDLGASLGVPAITAHRALTVAEGGPARLSPGALGGHTVLVSGGAGAVGHAAIQLARWAGATVIATVSSDEKAALATAAGAHHALRYTDDDVAASVRSIAPEGVDLIVEVAAGVNAPLNAAVLHTGGTMAIYGNDRGDALALDFRAHLVLNARLQFVLLYTVGLPALRSAADDITAALVDGALPIGEAGGLPVHRFPLERTSEAHAAVESGIVGKVLIDVAAE
ncbi:MAG: NADPH:quinone reductase [Microbacteriaceae bacterium]|jgi:NADPH2:quinone reductase|nr:NADPH:quinone reductase [Microbacteriaceae bacterium]